MKSQDDRQKIRRENYNNHILKKVSENERRDLFQSIHKPLRRNQSKE